MTTLTTVKSTLEHLTNAIEQLVRLLPEHGDVENDCQRLTMLNSISDLQSTINGLSEKDLDFDDALDPFQKQEFRRFNSLALMKLKATDLYIKNDNKGDNQVIRSVLGHRIVATLNDTTNIDLESESLLDSIDESLSYFLNQGFTEGQFEVCFEDHCTPVNWTY